MHGIGELLEEYDNTVKNDYKRMSKVYQNLTKHLKCSKTL